MLSRIEVGSKAHVLLWLADKDPQEYYEWGRWTHCPCALYASEHGLPEWNGIDPLSLNGLAGEFPRTWGALTERARKAWAE
jgi:hypothetical protein